MYDNLLVRKRRRRRIAAFVALFSSIGITSLVIISFLGRSVGTFTVSLNNSSVRLALCEKVDSTDYASYLRVSNTARYIENAFDTVGEKFTSKTLKRDFTVETLDNEETPSNCAEFDQTYIDEADGKLKKGKCLEFFKYTFYVKNVGTKTAAYDLSINIGNRTKASDDSGRGLDDTLRVMVFENDPNTDKHDYLIYAKKTVENNFLIDGVTKTDREFISYLPRSDEERVESAEHPLAETFVDSKTVAEYKVTGFTAQSIKRYTIVIWLDGNDPQSKPELEYPEGASLKLGVDIAAHENNKS